MDKYLRRCYVYNVVDGDTVDVEIDLGFRNYTQQRIRLLDIDTPELNDKDPNQRMIAQDAKNFVKRWVRERNTGEFPFLLQCEKQDSFGRWIGDIYSKDSECLSDELLQQGLAKPYSK